MTEIAQMLECLKRIEQHLAHIDTRIANIAEALLEKPSFVEWAEPQQLHQPEQP